MIPVWLLEGVKRTNHTYETTPGSPPSYAAVVSPQACFSKPTFQLLTLFVFCFCFFLRFKSVCTGHCLTAKGVLCIEQSGNICTVIYVHFVLSNGCNELGKVAHRLDTVVEVVYGGWCSPDAFHLFLKMNIGLRFTEEVRKTIQNGIKRLRSICHSRKGLSILSSEVWQIFILQACYI